MRGNGLTSTGSNPVQTVIIITDNVVAIRRGAIAE
jgi:hypothetical protein